MKAYKNINQWIHCIPNSLAPRLCQEKLRRKRFLNGTLTRELSVGDT